MRLKFYISLFFILVLIISIALFDYYALNKRIIAMSSNIIDVRKQSEILKSRLTYLSFIEKEEKRMIRERQRLEVFHSFNDTLEFISFLEENAESSGNQIKVTIKEGGTQSFNVQLGGSFNSLINFLIRLENIPAEIRLNHIISERRSSFIPGGENGITVNSSEAVSIKTELTIIPSQELPSIL